MAEKTCEPGYDDSPSAGPRYKRNVETETIWIARYHEYDLWWAVSEVSRGFLSLRFRNHNPGMYTNDGAAVRSPYYDSLRFPPWLDQKIKTIEAMTD